MHLSIIFDDIYTREVLVFSVHPAPENVRIDVKQAIGVAFPILYAIKTLPLHVLIYMKMFCNHIIMNLILLPLFHII